MNRFIVIIIAILLSGVIGVFFAYPKYQVFEEENAKLELKKKELQNLREYFTRIKSAAERLADYEEELEKIDSALPEEPSVPALLNFIQATVENRNLLLKDLNTNFVTSFEKNPSAPVEQAVAMGSEENVDAVGGELPSKEIQEISIDLTVAGSYEVFKGLLTDLEKSARLIEIENISFSSSGKVGEGYTFGLQLKTHSY